MAFFSDGNNEYFSLNLDPIKNEQSYVYELTKLQKLASQYSAPCLLLMSTTIFIAVVLISGMEFFGLVQYCISDSNRELLLLTLAGTATIIGFAEVFFFLWIRKNKLSSLNGIRSNKLEGITILIKKSWMTYLIFLLNVMVPFMSLAALPGGLAEFFNDISTYGSGFRIFLFQLFATLIIFLAFLSWRVTVLLFRT